MPLVRMGLRPNLVRYQMANQGVTPRSLFTHAVAFSSAAEAVHAAKIPDPLPKFFLWGRATELVLKSFLLAEGQSVAKLKSKEFGHDLNALLRDAEARGIPKLIGLNSTYCTIVRILNLDYLSKRFEYRETGATYQLPDITLTRQLVNRLLKGVDFHLKNHYGI